MKLPQWLDNLIFEELGGKFSPSYSDMTNIHDDKEKTLDYLGTYFPRSYAEAYNIFSLYFKKYKQEWEKRETISVFDFGSGTGGEIIGLLTVLNEEFPSLKKVKVVALDGNENAVFIYSRILNEFQEKATFEIINKPSVVKINNVYDLDLLEEVMTEDFDVIMTFKTICEFVTENQFENKNPYKTIVEFMLTKVKRMGVVLVEDVTSKNCVSKEWLPEMMKKGLDSINCCVVEKNQGYNEVFTISHSFKQNDKSKVSWRILKP